MVKIKNILSYFVVLYSLSAFYFYAPVFVNNQILKLCSWFLTLCIFAGTLNQFLLVNPKESRYSYDLKIIILLFLFSIIPAFFSWGQSPLLSIRGIFPYLSFVLFFFLKKFKPDIADLEKIIFFLCFTYIVCYFYAFYKAPTVVFGIDKIDDSRGITRLYVPGRSFVYLAYFLALSKYATMKTNKWLGISIFIFIIIVMHVIRQYIFFAFLIGFFIVFKEMKWWKKITIVLVTILGSIYIYQQLPILQLLVELTEGQLNNVDSGNEDIRVTSYRYFLTEFSPNLFSVIFGNGVPHNESAFGSFYVNTLNHRGLYMSDVGYAQIFAMFGAVGLFLFLRIFYKVLKQKNIPVELKYTKFFIIFMILANILSGLVLVKSSIICLVFVFYILEISYTENVGIENCNKIDNE